MPLGRRRASRSFPSPRADVAVFAFEDVRVELAGHAALDGLTLEVPPCGVTVVVGPSGAGKSTLARLCNRLEVPTSGSVQFRGVDVDALDPLVLRERVALVFQRPTLFGGTVRDNLSVTGVTEPSEHADVLERVHLGTRFLDREAASLSGGEAQRACLARALLLQPEVLVADEPTSALDPAATTALERLARSLAGEGMPIVWISHELAQLDRLADTGVVLVGGRVAAVGTPTAVRASAVPSVAAFLRGEHEEEDGRG